MPKRNEQPTKYDRFALEAEFLAGDSTNIRKFFTERKIPLKTGYRMSTGWAQKWKTIREKGLKTFQNRLAKEIAEQAETELVLSKGLIKVGADALFPTKEGVAGLRPTTAREAAQILQIGNSIRKNVTTSLQEAVRVEIETTQTPVGATPTGAPAPVGNIVTVKIMGPSNGRDQAGG